MAAPRPCDGDENFVRASSRAGPERRAGGRRALQCAPRLRLEQGGDRAPPRQGEALQTLEASAPPPRVVGPAAEQEGSVAVQGVPEVVHPAAEAEPGGHVRDPPGRAPVQEGVEQNQGLPGADPPPSPRRAAARQGGAFLLDERGPDLLQGDDPHVPQARQDAGVPGAEPRAAVVHAQLGLGVPEVQGGGQADGPRVQLRARQGHHRERGGGAALRGGGGGWPGAPHRRGRRELEAPRPPPARRPQVREARRLQAARGQVAAAAGQSAQPEPQQGVEVPQPAGGGRGGAPGRPPPGRRRRGEGAPARRRAQPLPSSAGQAGEEDQGGREDDPARGRGRRPPRPGEGEPPVRPGPGARPPPPVAARRVHPPARGPTRSRGGFVLNQNMNSNFLSKKIKFRIERKFKIQAQVIP